MKTKTKLSKSEILIDFHCKNNKKKQHIIVQINLIGQKIEFESSHCLTF